MPSDSLSITRRAFGAGLAAGTGFLAFALPVRALNTDQARALIDTVVAEVNSVINSGKSESAMFKDFEQIFADYADVPTIARSALGVASKSASASQMTAFTKAFRGYISRKYGRRFREFIGGAIEVREAREVPNGIEVETTAILQGQSPFRVDFQVSDRSGEVLFFNIIIEGINMLLSERTEVQAMLDARGGNLDQLIAELPQT